MHAFHVEYLNLHFLDLISELHISPTPDFDAPGTNPYVKRHDKLIGTSNSNCSHRFIFNYPTLITLLSPLSSTPSNTCRKLKFLLSTSKHHINSLMFGAASNPTSSLFLFGSTAPAASSGFGASNTNSGGLFSNQAKKPTTGLFGSSTAAPATSSLAVPNQSNSTFGNTSSGGLFGQKPAASTGFGGVQTSTSTPSTPFGAKPATAGGLFGASNTTTSGGLFGSSNTASAAPSGGLFGGGSSTQQQNTQQGGLLGSTNTNTNNAAPTSGLFGLNATAPSTAGLGGLFGNNNAAKPGGLFGNNNATKTGGLFGLLTTQNTTNTTGGLFGGSSSGGLFGGQQQQQQQQQQVQQQQQPQLTAMTRVGDLPPDVKKELQDFDKYISTQHLIATTLNEDLVKHDTLIKSIPNDVNYLHTKILSIKLALKFDTDQLNSLKTVNNELTEDIANVMQLIIQLSTPGTRLSSSYHLNEFFIKRIKKYRELLAIYEGVITEGNEAITRLEQSCNEACGNIGDVVQVVRNQYAIFMELCESLAEIHGEVTHLTR